MIDPRFLPETRGCRHPAAIIHVAARAGQLRRFHGGLIL
jgi:hypothetical protein